jgi:hypothetical protein
MTNEGSRCLVTVDKHVSAAMDTLATTDDIVGNGIFYAVRAEII